MTKLTRAETAQWLQERDRFLILTHRRPDGDTVGSSAALCRGLRALGKQAWVLENPELTAKYAYLHEGLTCAQALPEHTLIAVDTASPKMLPEAFAPLLPRIELLIDHHASTGSYARFSLVDAHAGACGEVIYDVLMALRAELDERIATALYVAVSTDTGCFRFANTTDHTFLVAAACAAAGAPVFEQNQALFETLSVARLRMQGWMMENSRMLCGGQVAVCAIPRSVEEKMGATEDDMDNISSFLRTIEGVKVAALLREQADGSVKVSVRSVPGIDSGAVCTKFGGGGHAGAAGATLRMPLQEAADALQEEILKVFNV